MRELTGRWLVWMWQYSVLEVEPFETLQEAVESAGYTEDAGNGALAFIEGPDGVVPESDIEAIRKPIREAERAEWAERPPATHVVQLATPGGREKDARVGAFSSLVAAREVAETWRAIYGDRVSVWQLSPYRLVPPATQNSAPAEP